MKKLYIIEVDESEIVECWNEQAAKEIGYQEYALKQCPKIKVKIYNPSGDLISREALRKEILDHSYDSFEDLWDTVRKAIDNAQTVPLPNEQIAWKRGYHQAKEDIAKRIKEQYNERHELIPYWLSIGDVKGGAE